MKIIIKALSTFSFLAMGSMISIYKTWWMIIPLLGILIFYGLNMAFAGKEKAEQELREHGQL